LSATRIIIGGVYVVFRDVELRPAPSPRPSPSRQAKPIGCKDLATPNHTGRSQPDNLASMNERIYLSPPSQSGREQEAVSRALASNWIAPLGPEVDAFESELVAVVGVDHALATSSGTAAIHLALLGFGVKPGHVVIAPSFTFIGSVAPVSYIGADSWFVDSEQESWNMDPGLLRSALTTARSEGRRVGAVIAVDLFGQCADYDAIQSICDEANVPLLEDAAEALGASYKGNTAGSFGRAGVLSFNGNKIITTSGGGAIVSDDEELMLRTRFLATQAREPEIHYEHTEIGFNYRMSNLLAAVGRAQLSNLDDRVTARRDIFSAYSERLADLPGIEFMPESPRGRSTRWLTTLTVDPDRFGASRHDIIRALAEANIEARPVWKPMHLQPVFAHARMFGGSVSDRLFAHGLCLPSGTDMSRSDIGRVADIVTAVHTKSV